MLLETFIKGIEVLDKTEIKEPTQSGLIIGCIIGFILLALSLISMDDKQMGQIVGGILFTLTVVIALRISVRPTGKHEYKVTITDEVSLNEFYENYEITDQEGKIYTIRFKE